MSHESISERGSDGPTYTLKSEAVRSAIQVLGDVPALYDKIYRDFPDAYNKAGGHFGRIGIVRMYDASRRTEKNRKYMRSQPTTHFTEQEVEYSYPDALIMPLVWGLRGCLETPSI